MPMPTYHFEIVDGVKLADPVGVDCKNDHHARIVANQIAKQIAIDVEIDGERNVVVVDERGDEIYTTPVKP
jgi:hypothetical protein